MNWLLILPLACGLAFPALAWLLKRSMADAKDAWGPLWVANTATVAVFAPPFVLAGDFSVPPDRLWQPLLCGFLFLAGQVAAFKSFERGDISLAVPVQGTKVLMVAALATLFLNHPAGWNIWAAAALTPVALFFLGDHAPGKSEARRHRDTVLLGTATAAALAGFDVGVQAWADAWGVWRFGFWAFSFQALLSLGFFWLPGRRFRFGAATWTRLLLGSFGLALVTLALTFVIAASGEAAWTNILFNSRLLWSVVLMALGARWLAESAKAGRQERKFLGRRFAGASLMMATIILAVS